MMIWLSLIVSGCAMTKLTTFYGFAHDFAGSFFSRNNDVDGYWAIGKLHRMARDNGASEVRIDLLDRTITPHSDEFATMIARAADLAQRLGSRTGLKPSSLIAVLDFDGPSHFAWTPESGRRGTSLTLSMENAAGAMFSSIWQSESRPHDPALEQRSIRKMPDQGRV